MKSATLVTALGRDPLTNQGSVNPPVHHTSTLLFNSFSEMRDYEAGKNTHKGYGRHGTPTITALENAIAELEGGDYCCITASGLAATVLALTAFLSCGDHLLVTDSIYGSTRKFITQELTRLGVEVTFYDPTIGDGIQAMIRANTKVVYVESPGSQTFEMQDIPAIATAAHAKGAIVMSDSTWATPFYQKPFDLGIDVDIQSVTKYIAGHSDLVMGAVIVKDKHQKLLKRTHLNMGFTPGADNVYLALRGLRSVMVRLAAHQQSALTIARWLEARSEIKRVLYPALESDPGHALWKRDMTGACGLFGIELAAADESAIRRFVDGLKHFGLGYSWGGYESLVTAYQPAAMRSVSQWDKDCWIIRLNIGLEDTDDLIADLEQALTAYAQK